MSQPDKTDGGSSTYRLKVGVPRRVRVGTREYDRDSFYSWLWESFGSSGLLGVHEGTLLTEEAAQAGLEAGAWMVDSAEAPRERDWVSGQTQADTELYFDTLKNAERARAKILSIPGLVIGEVHEQKTEDWDADWKASFKGADVPPFWKVVPPWIETRDSDLPTPSVFLRVNPGAGFGTGTHETTQLCLEALGRFAQAKAGMASITGPVNAPLDSFRVLDFGSGSGILAIGAALLGAGVDAVEIDPLAIDNAKENAELNGVVQCVRYSRELPELETPYEVVIANILKPVLLEFSAELVRRLSATGTLILSGLIEPDVQPVVERYSELLREAGRAGEHAAPEVLRLNEWRAIVWKP